MNLAVNSFEEFLISSPKVCQKRHCLICEEKFNKSLNEWVRNERLQYSRLSNKQIVVKGMQSIREDFMQSGKYIVNTNHGNKLSFDQGLLAKLFCVMGKDREEYKTSESLLSMEDVGKSAPFVFLSTIYPTEQEYKKIQHLKHKHTKARKISFLMQEETKIRNQRKKLESKLKLIEEKDLRSRIRTKARKEFIIGFKQMSVRQKLNSLYRPLPFPLGAIPEKLLPQGPFTRLNLRNEEILDLVYKIGNRKNEWKVLSTNLLNYYEKNKDNEMVELEEPKQIDKMSKIKIYLSKLWPTHL